jgi:hypothetical protein
MLISVGWLLGQSINETAEPAAMGRDTGNPRAIDMDAR